MAVQSREAASIELGGTELFLQGNRTVFCPAESTLFVADLHLGKGSAFRAGSIPVPSGSTQRTLDRLCQAVTSVDARRIVILGDMWHAKSGRTEASERAFLEWRDRHAERDVWLVEGNHDLKSGLIPESHRTTVLPPGSALGAFTLLHEPGKGHGYALAGHIHPAVRLVGRADQSVVAPCFWVQSDCMVLPAFGEFTGAARVRPSATDRVFVVVEGWVREV